MERKRVLGGGIVVAVFCFLCVAWRSVGRSVSDAPPFFFLASSLGPLVYILGPIVLFRRFCLQEKA